MKKYNKKGISLIVLVITIIVMIILAAAIILSISNSGIMDKANQAKTESDAANLKEYANVLEAEWELMTADERSSSGYASKEAYVNGKLESKGYTGALLMEDGTLYTNLQANAKAVLKAGIEIGDVVTGYTLDNVDSKKTYTTSGNENTAPSSSETEPTSQTVTRIEYTTWKYIGIGENGEVLIAPDMVSSVTTAQKIKLSGKGGYLNGPKELNDMCAAMYSTTKGTARSMNRDDITRILDYTGPKGIYYNQTDEPVKTLSAKKVGELENELNLTLTTRETPDGNDIKNYYSNDYSIEKTSTDILKSVIDDDKKSALLDLVYTSNPYFLASTSAQVRFAPNFVRFHVFCVNTSEVYGNGIFWSFPTSACSGLYATRPVIQLNSDVSVSYSNGILTLN